MKFLFITWACTDFSTSRTLAVGLQIPHVSKYILCDLANLEASWSCKHKQMVLAGVTPQHVCWKRPLEAPYRRGILHVEQGDRDNEPGLSDCLEFSCCTSAPNGLAVVALKNVPV